MVKKLDITTLISQHGDILTSLFDHMSDMFFLMAVEQDADEEYQFRYVLMNPSAMHVAQLCEEAYGKTFEDVYPHEKASLLQHMYTQAVKSGSPIHFTANGDIIGESILSPVYDSNGVCTHVFSITRDVTERTNLESQLAYMAYHDVLTGLPNRRLLSEKLQQALRAAQSKEEMVAALYLDCDRFKEINDTWGHDTGDLFLQMLATRLKSSVRDGDIVARLGGDEFVIVLTGIHSERQVEKIANRILLATQEPWMIEERAIPFSTSIGIALYPASASEAEQLLSNADKALYQAKNTGRNRFFFFDHI
ncbi:MULTISPECIES: GGDEF domain-containing protein [Brevibacillus]|uniref:GGDEF domain-containing protein n=1 Tax=Brevibacillus brevis TaxID=1393 RepID=A0A2Z4MCP3_BREBE|nr:MULTISPECIES: GGDEF domain-containing protein [Brevibacillus]AWX54254.1 GGDEF domain-containing protein [Brevibacillus brevis]NRR19771.1 GGDEF domain-containing protein [Brevibacillus sp. MS2.2]